MATAPKFVIGPEEENGQMKIPQQPKTTPIYPQQASAAFSFGPGAAPQSNGSTAGQASPGKSLQQLVAEVQNAAAGRPASYLSDATQAELVRRAGIDARLKNQEANYTYQAPATQPDASGFTFGPTPTGGTPGAQAAQGGKGAQSTQSGSSLYQTALSKLAADNKVDPFTTEFNEAKGVQGRVNSITSSGSPLMQAAMTRAKQDANRRGLMNSSMAAGAGQMAVINAALPIANADAGLYQQQTLANQDARNTIGLANAQNAIAAGTRGAEMDMNAQQFGVTSGQAQQQIDAQREQFAQQLGLSVQELGLKRDQLTQAQQQFLAELEQRQAQLSEQGRQFDASRQDNLGMFDRELAQKAKQFGLSQAQAIELAEMDVDNKIKLAEIEAGFKNEIQSSANIANAWGTVMQGIAQIQGNPELDENTKATLINNNLDSFKAFSAFWNKSTGIDVSDLLNLGVANKPGQNAPGDGPNPGEQAYDGNPRNPGGPYYDNQDWSSGA